MVAKRNFISISHSRPGSPELISASQCCGKANMSILDRKKLMQMVCGIATLFKIYQYQYYNKIVEIQIWSLCPIPGRASAVSLSHLALPIYQYRPANLIDWHGSAW
jgi:hypothetical protein